MTQGDLQILLVDDNPNDMAMALHALRQVNIVKSVQVVQDGEEALDFIFCRGEFAARSADHPPRVVLLDLKLPKVGGLDVLRAVKSDPRTQAIPIVVFTSSREEKDLVESYKLGVNAYVQKPTEFDSFRQALKEVGLFWLGTNESPPPESFHSR